MINKHRGLVGPVQVLRDHFRELPDAPPQWIRPGFIVEVEYRHRLKEGLRHAALKGLRPEKKPGVIRRFRMPKSLPWNIPAH